MGLVIIFTLVTIVSAISALANLKKKNLFGSAMAGVTFLVIGWFTVMTIIAMTNGGGVPAPL